VYWTDQSIAAAIWLATPSASGRTSSGRTGNASGHFPKVGQQEPDTAEVEVAPEDHADPLGLFLVDEELLVPGDVRSCHSSSPGWRRVEFLASTWGIGLSWSVASLLPDLSLF
jgi:hypothetical protein